MHKGIKITQITLNVIMIVIATVMVFLALFLVIERYGYDNYMPRLFGYSIAEVETGSMEPTIMTGDAIITKKCDEYVVDDIITFKDQFYDTAHSYTTHRIIEVNVDDEGIPYYTTQGDRENAAVDTYHPTYDDVVGKVVNIWDGGGNTLDFITSPGGIALIIGGVIIVWVIIDLSIYIYRITRKDNNDDSEHPSNDQT